MLMRAGVTAFQAPGKRHKAQAHEPGAKNGQPLTVQLPEAFQTPRPPGLPHLRVPTPGTGDAKATMESSTAAPVPVSPYAPCAPYAAGPPSQSVHLDRQGAGSILSCAQMTVECRVCCLRPSSWRCLAQKVYGVLQEALQARLSSTVLSWGSRLGACCSSELQVCAVCAQ